MFGIAVPVGAPTGIGVIGRVLADPQSPVLKLTPHTASQPLEEIRLLEARISQVERQLSQAAWQSPAGMPKLHLQCRRSLNPQRLERIIHRI